MNNPLIPLLLLIGVPIFSQVGINTDKPGATLHIAPSGLSSTTPEGILLPSLTREQIISKDAVYTSEQNGVIVYITDLSGTTTDKTRKITSVGYYYFTGTLWEPLTSENSPQGAWNKLNTTEVSINNSDNVYLKGRAVIGGTSISPINKTLAALTVYGGDIAVNNITVGTGAGNVSTNSVLGYGALASNTTAGFNTAIGYNSLTANDAYYNTAIGSLALTNNISGNYNVAIGTSALNANVSGVSNTAVGHYALFSSTGNNNTALGAYSLNYNTSGSQNTAVGYKSLFNNRTGDNNTAFGYDALNVNSTGANNTAIGSQALSMNSSGSGNTVVGRYSLANNTTGNYNTILGFNVFHYNKTGIENTFIGNNIFTTPTTTEGSYNIAIGSNTNLTSGIINNSIVIGSKSSVNADQAIAIGSEAVASGVNSIALGYGATNTIPNSIVLGNNDITTIYSKAAGITALSDGRVKKDVQANVPGLSFINRLRPVTYHLDAKAQADITGTSYAAESAKESEKILQSGFIAQEVENAAKEIGYDFNGIYTPKNEKDTYGLNYSSFVVPLVKAIQEQQKQIENYQQQLKKQQDQIDQLNIRLKYLEK